MLTFPKTVSIAVCAASLMAALPAASATVSHTIDFEDAPDKSSGATYISGPFTVEPVNIQSGQCFTGDCTIETNNAELPMVYLTDGGLFNFDMFWFSFQGNGGPTENNFTLEAFKDGSAVEGSKFEIRVEDLLVDVRALTPVSDIQFMGGEADGGNSVKAECIDEAPKNGGEGPFVCKSAGYKVTLGSVFDDVDKVQFVPATTAQIRLDDFMLSYDCPEGQIVLDGSCTFNDDDDDETPPVPLPAAGWMLIAGVGGLCAMRRRRKS